MRIAFNHPKLKFHIGDVRNFDSINEAMRGVDFVFHTAALKQVPSCEFYPMEAIRTKVLGAENVLNAAINHRVQRISRLVRTGAKSSCITCHASHSRRY